MSFLKRKSLELPEPDMALPGRDEPLAVPDPAVQIQESEPREVSGVGVDLAAEDEVAEAIGAEQGVPHPDLVE